MVWLWMGPEDGPSGSSVQILSSLNAIIIITIIIFLDGTSGGL